MTPAVRKRVLFVHNDDPRGPLSSFFLQDIEVLRRWYDVELLSVIPYGRDWRAFSSTTAWRAVSRCDGVFGWFGSSAPIVIMASLLRKPSVVVAGGYDVVHVPEIGYGLDPKNRRQFFVWLSAYRLARRVLLFSESSRDSYLALPGIDGTKAQTLYLGVDGDHFKPQGEKKPHVLTIAYISEMGVRRKGVRTVIEAARLTPEVSYRIGGRVVDRVLAARLADSAPPNVTFLGSLSDDELLRELQSAKIYAQLSFHEGFGAAVAEAMACECVPIVTNRGSLPEVVGNLGRHVPPGDPAAAARAIREVLDLEGTGQGALARKRILEKFRPSDREDGLRTVMEDVLRS